MAEEKTNGQTELVFILDRSGSMSGLESDTIGGFNGMVAQHKGDGADVLVSTVFFDHEDEVIHDRVRIAEVPVLTDKEYFTRGSTALLDAMGGAIHHIKNVHKYARPEDRPARTMFIITTDGMENASTEFTKAKVKELISDKQEKAGWDFIYLGANIDAAEEADAIGVRKANAVTYKNTSSGVRANYGAVGVYVAERASGDKESGAWKDHVERDTGK